MQTQKVAPSCDLYLQYFSDRLSRLRLNLLQESRLATLVYTGVAEYEAHRAVDLERSQNLLYQDFQIITQLCQQFEGQVLKSIDDGLLLYFPSVSNAVSCAQEMLLALKQAAKLTSEPLLTHRIGIHFGDDTDIIGTRVNIAVRMQAEAPPGGICLSQSVYEAVKNRLPLQPINMGQQQLEGIEKPIVLYQLPL